MTEEPDDWFERAIADDDSSPSSDSATAAEPRPAAGSPSDELETGGWDADGTDSEDCEDDTDGEDGADGEGGTDIEGDTDAEDTTDGDGGGSLFDEDFGSALRNTADPAVGSRETVAGGEAGLELEFDSSGDTDFEADVDSALSRLELGVEGLDGMIQGGVPERSLMVAIGGAGTGKTTFGLQFLDHALTQGEHAVFIALEESRERVITSATEKGYPFGEYVAEDRLAIVDLDPVEMANSLASIQTELPGLVDDFDASRLVLDSVSLLEMMYDDQATRRNEVYDFTKSLKDAGVTALLTSEASERTAYASRHGIIEYLTDAVFVLQYVRPDDFRETRLAVEIQKIRDANHSREKKPYEITDDGISVHQQANLF